MENPILRTKLQRPPVAPDTLPRARLLDRLNEGRRRTLTLISAPAGYGKSTLASRWAAACDCPSGWVSLDKRDNDPSTFLSYLLAALQPLFPEAAFRTQALLETIPLPPPSVLAGHLINDLQARSEPFVLVLDDYHYIRDLRVHDLLTELLTHPPPALHLVLVTRSDPPLPSARLRGRGQLAEIRAGDLRFTRSEASAFLSRMLKVAVDDDTAAALDEKTEGWVTGLRLAGLYLQGRNDVKQKVQEIRGTSRHFAEYLAEEVLARQHPEIVDFLLEASILDRFCAPLCRALHAKDAKGRDEEVDVGAQRFVGWLIESNMFVVPLDDQGYWFRYHHLFRQFLKSRLLSNTHADKIARMHALAGNWFAENNLVDEAIRHKLEAGNTQDAVGLVIEHRYELMNTGQFVRLRQWLASLQENAFEESPLLVSTRALIGLEQGQDKDLLGYTDKADRMLSRLSPQSAGYGLLKSEVRVLQGFIDMAMGHPDRGRARSEEALHSAFLPENHWLVRSLGIFTLAGCHQMTGNLEHAVKLVSDELLNPAWPVNIRARMHFYLSATQYMNANLVAAISSSQECIGTLPGLSFTHTRNFAVYLIGAAHYLRNEVAEAESHLRCVLDDFHLANPSYVGNAGYILACIYLAGDCPEKAEQVLKQIGAHFQEGKHTTMLAMSKAFQVEFALRRGDIERASQLSQGVDFDIRPPLWFFYVPQLTPVRLSLARGDSQSLEAATVRLAELDQQLLRINRNSVRIDALALLSLVCDRLGDTAAALEKLKSALLLAEPGGFIRNFVDLGAPMAELLGRLNEAHPGHPYAHRVAAAFRAEHSNSASSGPEPVSRRSPASDLTPREIELLQRLAEGLSNSEIAERLYIATDTVKTHLQNIYRKLGTKSRTAALKAARELGVLANN